MRLRMLLGVVALTCGFGPGALSASLAGANVPIEAAVIDAGDDHSCAIEFSGEVLCWGDNFNGQLGDPDVFSSNTAIPVAGLTDAVQVSAGGDHTCALRGSGQVLCWGYNLKGQLGDGTTTQRHTPAPVSGLTDAVEISAGDEHTCAIRKSGQAVCWGNNLTGQVGDGTSGPFPVKTPTPVSGLNDAEMIGAGRGQSCAIKGSGQAVCWGNNLSGELGLGVTGGQSNTPVQVGGLTDAALIAVGSYHACAVRKGGEVVCWGSNSNGQLGAGFGSYTGPVDVLPFNDAEWISGGEAHTCAIRESGPTRCWGWNASGQLGDDSKVDKYTPTANSVTGLADGFDVSAGGSHSCAVRETGETLCWGDNLFGQLGDGSNSGRLLPVTVVEAPFVEDPPPKQTPVPIATVPPPASSPKKPKLALTKPVSKTLTARPGVKVALKVKVKNTGNATARGVKVCPTVKAKAKPLMEALVCKTVGALQPKAAKTAMPSVTTTAQAEGEIKVKLKLSSANAGGGSASVTLKLGGD